MTDATKDRTLIISLTDEEFEQLKGWMLCTRIKLVPVDDEQASRLVIDTKATCHSCKGTGRFTPEPGIDMQCRYCEGTGLRR